MVRWEKN